MTQKDKQYMQLALAEAQKAFDLGEVPVGAVVVYADKVIARAHNRRRTENDACAHAELLALREAGKKLSRWQLSGCTLYVTLEPCPMCAAACIQARLSGVVFGAFDAAAGGCGSVYKLTADTRLGPYVPVTGGVCGEECRALLAEFFAQRRKNEEKPMQDDYICKIATVQELDARWDVLVERYGGETDNWLIWRKGARADLLAGDAIVYFGLLGGRIICEATAMLNPAAVEESDGLVDEKTAYLKAFRTDEPYQGQGYFSRLFRFMLDDLTKRGYTRVTLGVEPTETKNKAMYAHYGFREYIKTTREAYPDGTPVVVEYYARPLG